MIEVRYDRPKRLGGRQSIFVTFPYSQEIVAVIRCVPERFWDSKNSVWELDYKAYDFLREHLPNEEFSVIGEPIDSGSLVKKDLEQFSLPESLQTELFSYQRDDYNILMNFEKRLVLHDTGLGKAQPLYSKVLTPNGFVNMGDIKVGMRVMGEDGKPYNVLGVYPQGKRDIYELKFSDGSTCRCSDNHLWTMYNRNKRYKKVTLPLSDIIDGGLFRECKSIGCKQWTYQLPKIYPIEFVSKEVPINPWLFGFLLGDGSFRNHKVSVSIYEDDVYNKCLSILVKDGFSLSKASDKLCGDLNIIDTRFNHKTLELSRKDGIFGNRLTQAIYDLGLLEHYSYNKFIPEIYKNNSYDVRLAVLVGLYDADGYTNKSSCCLSVSSKQLAEDVVYLVRSLGGTCSCSEHSTSFTSSEGKKAGRNNFEMVIKLPEGMLPFSSSKHKSRYALPHTTPYRSLREISYIGKEECQCIYVSNPTHLYITDDFIPTHNTVICSAVAEKRRELGLVDHALILCLNTLTVNWYREIKKHFNMESTILGARKDKRGNLIVKSNKDKLEDLKNLKTYFLITNIESLQNKDIVQELVNLCKKKRIMIIEDEIHKGVSNPGTKQGKAFLRLKPKYSLGLSGTLLTNSALNLYTPLKFVDGFKSNYNAFKSHYVIYGGYGGYQVVGYKNLAELQVLVDTYSIKRKKGDVLDLPEINFKNEYLQMGKAQSKIYAEVLEQTLADVDKIVASVNPLSMLMRLRQCTATTEIVSTTVNESIKFDRMEEIIEDVVSRGEKLIVFSNWTQVLDFAKLRLKYDFAMVTGEVKDKQAQLDKFTNDDNCKILLATIGAAGTGLTLTVANTLLFLDSPWNYATFTQVSSRIHRIGQTKNCDIISLLATNTIDERIMDIVEKKKKLGEAVVDGKYNLKDRKVLEWLLE